MFINRITKTSLLVIATVSMVMVTAQSVRAQEVRGSVYPEASFRAADPVVEAKYLRAPKARRRLSPEDKNGRKLALEITEGNQARRNSEYQRAVEAYERAALLDKKDPRPHHGLGNVYLDLSCADSAIAEFRAALLLKSNYRDALFGLASALVTKQRYDEAEAQYQQVLKLKKDDTGGRVGLAFVLWKRKKYDEAIERLKQITVTSSTKNDDRAAVYLILGDIYREQAKWDDARENYKQALALNSAHGAADNYTSVNAAIGLGLTRLLPAMDRFGSFANDERPTEERAQVISAAREAEEYFRRAIFEFKHNHPSGYLLWALALEFQLQFRDAENKFSAYLKAVEKLEADLPTIAKTKTCDYGFGQLKANYYRFQALSYQQERFLTSDHHRIVELDQKTIECLQQVIRLKGDDAFPYSALAGLYALQKKYAAAIEQYDHALSREMDEKKKASYYSGRGNAYAYIGRIKDAIDDLNRAIRIKPDDPLAYWNLSSLHEQQGNWDEAIAVANKALEHQSPPPAHSYFFHANIHFRRWRRQGNQADFEMAVKQVKQAISIQPAYASAYLLLGSLYKLHPDSAKSEEALVNYELAAKYDPKNAAIHYGLGDFYYAIKKNDNAAIQSLKTAVALKPDHADSYWLMGKAYFRKGDDAEAVKQFQNAIKHDPKQLDAYIELAGVYDRQKNFEEALKWLLKATEEFPTDYLPYKEAARVYSQHQKNDEAIRYYEKAIDLVDADLAWFGEVMKCRVTRLRAKYTESIACLQGIKLPSSADPAQIPYDLGLTHVASGNKQAAQAQYEELKRLKSSLAEDLLKQINEMK
jgi:tetratricopeptide (TPR) repeat protein